MRRMTLLAAVALCAVASSALAASGASAVGTTAYTCVEGPPNEFGNAHCSEGYVSGEGWRHEPISVGETTQLTLKQVLNTQLESTVALAAIDLEATEDAECVACHFTNNTIEPGVPATMRMSGEGRLRFTGVIVKKLETKCEVHPPGNPAEPGVVETELLKFETVATNEIRFKPVAVGGPLAKFEITAKPGQKCNVAGKDEVTGFFAYTTNGSTLFANVPLSSGDLDLDGEPASLTGELTLRGGPTGAEHHPVALT